MQIAWTIVNDSYHTDVCLRFPPFMIALSAIYISCVYVERDVRRREEERERERETERDRVRKGETASERQTTSVRKTVRKRRELRTVPSTLDPSVAPVLTAYTLYPCILPPYTTSYTCNPHPIGLRCALG